MISGGEAILFAGQTDPTRFQPEPRAEHLGCFSGGMVAVAARIFDKEEDMEIAKQLVEGCMWAYENMPQGLMPEIMHLSPCATRDHCDWNETAWISGVSEAFFGDPQDAETIIKQHHLPKGITKVDDTRYILR